MAYTDDLILKKGQIIITQSSGGTISNFNLDNSPLLFGTVQKTSDLSELYTVGDTVLFDPTGATKFSISVTKYFLTTEDKVYTREITPP